MTLSFTQQPSAVATSAFPSLSEAEMASLAAHIDSDGFAVLSDCVPMKRLADLQNFVMQKVANAGGEYVGFTTQEATSGTLLSEIAASEGFQTTCQRLYELATGEAAPPAKFYQVLRCLSGKSGEKHSYIFHYDSFVLTVLFPIVIPQEGQAGDLIMFPNTRKLRGSYVTNLVDKVLLDNPVSQRVLKMVARGGMAGVKRIRMKPGNAYFFWGARSVHANEPCDPSKVRATALFHYVDPHEGSWVKKALKRK